MTPNDRSIVKKLAAYTHVWGGGLLSVTPKVFDGFARCRNFSHAQYTTGDLGVLYHEKLIVYVIDSAPEIEPVSIVHEIGHVFASKKQPYSSKEFGFFGWEYTLCQRVGITLKAWRKSHAHYQVGNRRDGYALIKDMSAQAHEKLIQQAIRHAVRHGLIDANGNPVSIRDLNQDEEDPQRQRQETR